MCDDYDSGSSSSSDSGSSYGGGYSGGGGASADYNECSTPSVSVRDREEEIHEAPRHSNPSFYRDSNDYEEKIDRSESISEQISNRLVESIDDVIDDVVEDVVDDVKGESVELDFQDMLDSSTELSGEEFDFQQMLEEFQDVSIDEIMFVLEEIFNLDTADQQYFMQNNIRAKKIGNTIIFNFKGFNCIIEVDMMTWEYTITAHLCETGHFLEGMTDTETVDVKYVSNFLELLKLNSRISPCAISIIDDGDDDLTNDAVVMSLTQLITDGLKLDFQLAMNNFCSSLVIVKETLFSDNSEE